MDQLSTIQQFSIWVIPVLFAITVHEAAHGLAASKLGDHTAKMLGRITLNPIKHIDPIGTVLVPSVLFLLGGFIFGWAKPVPVNFSALGTPRRDTALVALAGPAANFLMAILWVVVAHIGVFLQVSWLVYSGSAGILINLMLGVLNLLPLLPLDGGRILSALLPPQLSYQYSRLEPYGFLILIALVVLGLLGDFLLPIVRTLYAALVTMI